ncbi:LamG domain-containing protein [bacterium]|nr:LamG domain-containing protein [bacterium]
MGFFRGPKIVTDGLIFAVDAGSKRSYPGTGTNVKDLAGNHPGGTLSGGTTIIDNNYFHFDGSNDSLAFAPNDVFELSTTSFTMEAWARLNDNTGTNNFNAIIGGGNPLCDGCNGGYFLFYNGTNAVSINLRFDDSGLGNLDSLTYNSGTTFEDGIIHHVVGLRDGTNTKIYLDGTLVATGTDNSPNVNDISTFYISGWSNYRGDMDVGLARLYNKPLTADEVLQNYNAQKSRFNS